jgi:hypothetical protein
MKVLFWDVSNIGLFLFLVKKPRYDYQSPFVVIYNNLLHLKVITLSMFCSKARLLQNNQGYGWCALSSKIPQSTSSSLSFPGEKQGSLSLFNNRFAIVIPLLRSSLCGRTHPSKRYF